MPLRALTCPYTMAAIVAPLIQEVIGKTSKPKDSKTKDSKPKDSKPKDSKPKTKKVPILVEDSSEEKAKAEAKAEKELITLTFGDAAENHKGMEQIGHKLEEGQGFTLEDLQAMRSTMELLGVSCEIISLSDQIPDSPPAHVLVMKQAVTFLAAELGSFTQLDLFNEQKKLAYDTKAFMYGRVVNKHARWNLCFDDASRGPLYEEGKGTIVGYDEVPLMKGVRERFGVLFGPKATGLKVESNYYYDTTKCGIGYHGDSERVKVIAMRLGYSSMPIYYQWFYKGEAMGDRIEIPLDAGDMYVMSEKAVGADWKKKNVYTLRHATGCKKYVSL